MGSFFPPDVSPFIAMLYVVPSRSCITWHAIVTPCGHTTYSCAYSSHPSRDTWHAPCYSPLGTPLPCTRPHGRPCARGMRGGPRYASQGAAAQGERVRARQLRLPGHEARSPSPPEAGHEGEGLRQHGWTHRGASVGRGREAPHAGGEGASRVCAPLAPLVSVDGRGVMVVRPGPPA